MKKVDFLEGRTLITQSDVSFLLNNNKQIQIHYLVNGKPNLIQCHISKIIESFINREKKGKLMEIKIDKS